MREAGRSEAASVKILRPVEADPPLRNNLPAQLTSLIGREREVAAAGEILMRPEVRLLTLTGPGGVGKTRLGLRVAEDLTGDFADGVCFVPLAAINDPELVVSAIAQTLGLQEAGERRPLEQLKDYLGNKRLLLVLDNFEHVAAVAPLITDLLGACPRLKVLVTSREALHLSGEHEYAVPPLELPDPKQLPGIEDLSRYPAVELFVRRSLAVKADFALTGENAPAVVEVCARLDGLPLAIELAVARIKLLPPHKMLARLEQHRLGLLAGAARDLPARQQTLSNAIEWSHDLLDADERRLFRRLSVFTGGCTLEAAESVCDATGYEVLDGLASLVDKSLLRQVEERGGEPRLTMLRVVREYALERLAASGEAEGIQAAHAACYLALAEAAEPKLTGAEQGEWLERLEADHDNLRTALSWSLEREESETALRLGGALWRFWLPRGYLSEGRRWLEEALAGSALPLVRAEALNGAGVLAHYQGDYGRAATLCGESLNLSRQLGDKRGAAAALHGLALVACSGGRYAAARAMYGEALAISKELDDRWGIAHSLLDEGILVWQQGEYAEARPLLEESLALFRELGDRRSIARSLGLLSQTATGQGDYATARVLAEEAVAIVRELGNRRDLAKVLNNLGYMALVQGDHAAARALYEEVLVKFKELGEKRFVAFSLEGLAAAAAGQGQPVRAARLFGAAASLLEAIGASLPPYFRPEHERGLAAIHTRLDEVAFAAAWDQGRVMTPEQILAGEERAPAPEPGEAPSSRLPSSLTAREVEVLRLVAEGLTNQEITGRLFLSIHTVKRHVANILHKLDASSRTRAVARARELGII